MYLISLEINLTLVIAIVAAVVAVLIAGVILLIYKTTVTSIVDKVFLRPRPRPQVDRSPKKIERDTVIGRGRNWFYANRMQFLNVGVTSFDGTHLAGYYRPSAERGCNNAVILIHGYDEHPSKMAAYARLIMKQMQCSILIIHQRAHLMSEGDIFTYGLMESCDLDAWFDFLKKRMGQDCHIYIMGRSTGALTALLAAQQQGFSENVAGIIADSPGETLTDLVVSWTMAKKKRDITRYMSGVRRLTEKRYGFDIERCDCSVHAGRIKVPVLIFQGGDDDITKPLNTRHIFDNLRCEKRMVVIDNAGHIQCYDKAPSLYENEMRKFIETCMVRLVKIGKL
ncbi:MAG: acetylxylan esterase [Clostridiales bacterium]|nr:acetylxylan esterase [Clostridiales bacterium]